MASPMVQVNVRVQPELHRRLMKEAASTRTTLTAVVTEALHAYFDNKQVGGKGK